jgi:hypothetical protein
LFLFLFTVRSTIISGISFVRSISSLYLIFFGIWSSGSSIILFFFLQPILSLISLYSLLCCVLYISHDIFPFSCIYVCDLFRQVSICANSRKNFVFLRKRFAEIVAYSCVLLVSLFLLLYIKVCFSPSPFFKFGLLSQCLFFIVLILRV